MSESVPPLDPGPAAEAHKQPSDEPSPEAAPNSEAAPTERRKICSSCGDAMPARAVVCRQCRNFQGWRWWLRLLGLSLPWLSIGFYAFTNWENAHAPTTVTAHANSVGEHRLALVIAKGDHSPLFFRGASLVCTLKEAAQGRDNEKMDGHGASVFIPLKKENGPFVMTSPSSYEFEFTLRDQDRSALTIFIRENQNYNCFVISLLGSENSVLQPLAPLAGSSAMQIAIGT